MSYASDVPARRIGQLDKWGVHVRWAGQRPRLWKFVIDALGKAEARTHTNATLGLVMCVSYGGRTEIIDAIREIGHEVAVGHLRPEGITEKSFGYHLYLPDVPGVDLMVRTSGEKRISNYLPWQLAYSEMMFVDTPWPPFDRKALWDCLLEYAGRDWRFGDVADALGSWGACSFLTDIMPASSSAGGLATSLLPGRGHCPRVESLRAQLLTRGTMQMIEPLG